VMSTKRSSIRSRAPSPICSSAPRPPRAGPLPRHNPPAPPSALPSPRACGISPLATRRRPWLPPARLLLREPLASEALMRRAPLLLLVGLPLLFGAFQRAPLPEPQGLGAGLHLGAEPEKVVQRLGQPHLVCRQILAQSHREQWLYQHPHFLRLEFHCPRG